MVSEKAHQNSSRWGSRTLLRDVASLYSTVHVLVLTSLALSARQTAAILSLLTKSWKRFIHQFAAVTIPDPAFSVGLLPHCHGYAEENASILTRPRAHTPCGVTYWLSLKRSASPAPAEAACFLSTLQVVYGGMHMKAINEIPHCLGHQRFHIADQDFGHLPAQAFTASQAHVGEAFASLSRPMACPEREESFCPLLHSSGRALTKSMELRLLVSCALATSPSTTLRS